MKKWNRLVFFSICWFANATAQINLNLNSSYFSAYDIAFHNPAGIALLQRGQGAIGMQLLYAGLSGDNLRSSLASYVQPLGDIRAVGLRAVYFTSNLSQQGSFSLLFGQKFFGDVLSLGLNANLLTYSYNSDKFQLVDSNDPVVLRGTSKNAFSFGMGLLFQPMWRLSFGASIDHLNRPEISIDNSGVKKHPTFKLGMSAGIYPLVPQIDLKVEGHNLLFQGGIRQSFLNRKVNIFAGYDLFRTESRNLFVEANFLHRQFGFSYNYQYPLTELNQVSDGSHRFTVLFSKGGFPGTHEKPVISLINPKRSIVSSEIIKVSGYVATREGITAIEIKKNNKIERRVVYKDKPQSVDLMHDVPLDEGQNEIQILARAGNTFRTKKIWVNYTLSLDPPQITWLSPVSTAADSGKYMLHAQISDARGLVSARIFINGEEVKSFAYPERDTQVEIRAEVALPARSNHVLLIATNDKKENMAIAFIENPYAMPAPALPIIVAASRKDWVTPYSRASLLCGVSNVDSLADISIKVNGTRLALSESEVEHRTDYDMILRKNIDLQAGRNSVVVQAFNRDGFTSRELEIFVNPLMLTSLYRKTWAIIIGLDKYHDTTIDSLDFAVRDAQGVEKVLREEFHFDHFINLYDKAATKDNIRAALGDSLKNTEYDDGVFVFFAGHGSTELTRDEPVGYIVPFDGAIGSHAENISMAEIQEASRIPKAKHIFFVIDACYSGLLLVKTRGASQPNANINFEIIRELASKPARDVLTAGAQGEQVLDGGLEGHSIFTGRLLEGLRGAADFNQDSYVTAKELSTYVQAKVVQDSRARNVKQTPQFGKLTPEDGDFVFVRKY